MGYDEQFQRLEFEEILQIKFSWLGLFQKNPYKIVNGQKIAKTESDYTEVNRFARQQIQTGESLLLKRSY
jgi:hypothetical protein